MCNFVIISMISLTDIKSLPSASGLAFRHELKIKRAQRRMSDDRCLENIEITDLILPLRALWLSQKTALSFKIYLLLLRVTKSNVKESIGTTSRKKYFYERKHTVFKRPAFESIVVIRLDCRMEAPL
ncbi:uncharacterized protein EV154DRAFT_489075 [Mucor mucedo]|uniref:uncharacterized protein n=1 Tax=Mucor mucedo TaxID=29922 RepID=UPI00221EBE87|nr:uncharacterized protein EV154DRAFT_489075 [Mucor mucedo]KAI7863392.1 hypothetical protein EV154DRAFT_489075 [Mucor mucedo]